jgi:predicted nucleic acid-binding protein
VTRVIIDTGPLVSLFDQRAAHHAWVVDQYANIPDHVLTCEAVMSESVFLMRRAGLNPEWLIESVRRGAVRCKFDLWAEIDAIHASFRRYRDQSISIADASLVRMSELEPESVIFTLDRDFLVYRRNGRQRIPLIAPFV